MTTETRLTVRYAETDQMGIVHHSRYFPWFEVARTDFIKSTGMTYTEMERMGIWLPLCESGAKYIKGLRYEDSVIVTARLEKLSVARCRFAYEVFRENDAERELMATGFTEHGFTTPMLKAINLKKSFPEVWAKLSPLAEKK